MIIKIQYCRLKNFLKPCFIGTGFFFLCVAKKNSTWYKYFVFLKIFKVDGIHPGNFSLKDESHRRSLKPTSWNQASYSSEIEDLFADSHIPVKLI